MHERVDLLALVQSLLECRCLLCKKPHAAEGIVAIGRVASEFRSAQHCRVGHSPFVAGQTEIAALQLLASFVEFGIGVGCDVVADAVDGCLHLFGCHESVVVAVGWFHEVEWGSGIVLHLLCLQGHTDR